MKWVDKMAYTFLKRHSAPKPISHLALNKTFNPPPNQIGPKNQWVELEIRYLQRQRVVV